MRGRRADVPARAVAAPPPNAWWTSPRGAAILVALAAIVAFARSLGNDFTYDEGMVIVGAQRFLRSSSFGTLLSKGYFGASFEGTWRPFCTFTYMLDASVAMHPAAFKAGSLIWHILAAWMVMAFARRLLPEGRRRWAIVAGLLFALHPITTETVDNASFREDSLVTLFTLATLVLALDRRRPILALACYTLGLLSKESAVMAPALLILLRLGRFDQPAGASRERTPIRWGALIRELVPFGVVTVVYLGLRFGPLNTPVQYARYPGGTFGATLMGLPAIWAHDLRLLVWPWPLCADYTGYFRFGRQPLAPVVLAIATVAAYLAFIVVAVRKGERVVALGLGWFLLTLLPVSNLLPIPIPAAERFLYLPLAGIALAAAALYGRVAEAASPGGRRRLALVATGLLAACALIVNLRHLDWRDNRTLWLATVAVNPRSCGAQSAVGGDLLSRGMASGDRAELEGAAAREELALTLCTDDSDPFRAAFTYTRLGAARLLLGERNAARAALVRATVLHPRLALPFAWLGYLAYQEGDPDQAATFLKRAIIDLGPPDGTVAAVARLYVDKI